MQCNSHLLALEICTLSLKNSKSSRSAPHGHKYILIVSLLVSFCLYFTFLSLLLTPFITKTNQKIIIFMGVTAGGAGFEPQIMERARLGS